MSCGTAGPRGLPGLAMIWWALDPARSPFLLLHSEHSPVSEAAVDPQAQFRRNSKPA
jgi:hypothetical protein